MSRRVVAIIQARLGSSRLPGKILLPLGGQSVLGNVVARVRSVKSIADVVVATTESRSDDAVVAEATRLGVETVRGSEQDVLARYAAAALESRADAVVRVTSDCPLLDPSVTESVVRRYLDERCACDYASNTIVRSYPRGLDVEVFSAAALASAAEEAVAPEEREHVTLFFHNNASRFSRSSLVNARDLSGHRWTLDTEEDYRFLSEVFREFPIGVGSIPSFQEVVSFLDGRPAIVAINAGIRQKPVSRELNS